jgi:hypothetical protein
MSDRITTTASRISKHHRSHSDRAGGNGMNGHATRLGLEDQLEQFFYPVSPQSFFAHHWERKPLLIRGARDKFEHLGFSSEVLHRIGRDPADSQVCKAWTPQRREFAIDPRSIQRHYNAGRSVCMSDVHLRHEPLRQVVAALKAVPGLAHEIGFACYVSPSQQGIALHCDRYAVFILQIEGEKEWRYARSPSVDFPLVATFPGKPATMENFLAVHGRQTTRIPRQRELARTVLRTGDLLYLPAGTFHATHAPNHSLSLTLGCGPRSFASIIGKAIERAFRDSPEWRRNPPPIKASEAGGASAIERLLRSRIRDLSRWLSTVEVDEVTSVWRSHVADFRWDPPVLADQTEISPETQLVRVWPVSTSSARRSGRIEVVAANRIFTVPRRHHRLVDGLVSHARFSAGETAQWGQCSWTTARAFVELLLHHGIIEVA